MRGRGTASGAVFESEIAYLFTYSGGQIRREESFRSHQEALEAAGLRVGDVGGARRGCSGYLCRVGEGNLEAGATLYDPDIVFMAPDGGRVTGLQEAQTWMRRWLEAWDDLTMTAEEVIYAGDTVVVAVRERGVGKESGIPSERSFFQVWTFRGRSVIRLEQMRDRAEALEAAGLSE